MCPDAELKDVADHADDPVLDHQGKWVLYLKLSMGWFGISEQPFCPNLAAAPVLPIQPKFAPESKMKSPLLLFFPKCNM